MISNKISIKRILELKGGSLEELQQYAKTKGIYLPDDLTYCLTSTELKAIDHTLFCGQGIEHNIPSDTKGYSASNPQPIGFRGNLLVKRQKFFYCTYSLGITETS